MLEELALSISTLVFLLCTFVVNSLAPAPPSEPMEPSEPVVAEISAESADFDLVGVWNSNGRIYEFTSSGKLLYNDRVMPYEINGDLMTIKSDINGNLRIYTLTFEPLSERVMKLNGVALYKTSR